MILLFAHPSLWGRGGREGRVRNGRNIVLILWPILGGSKRGGEGTSSCLLYQKGSRQFLWPRIPEAPVHLSLGKVISMVRAGYFHNLGVGSRFLES